MAPRTAAKKKARSDFGSVLKLPSGRFRARYRVPGTTADQQQYITAPHTFATERQAGDWLALERAKVLQGVMRKVDGKTTFQEYAQEFLDVRSAPLKRRTRDHYVDLLNHHLLPTFGPEPLSKVDADMVKRWYVKTLVGHPTMRAHAYSLLASIFKRALADQIVDASPCRIRGAGTSKRKKVIVPASLRELEIIVNHVPDRYKMMILLAAWCTLRQGELTELRVKDLDFKRKIVKISRGCTWVKGEAVIVPADKLRDEDDAESGPTESHVDRPKSDAGVRHVTIPPHLVDALRDHVRKHCAGIDSLLFPAARDSEKHMRPATLYKVYYPARAAAGRPDLRFHDLRHTGAVLAAQTGATLAELMSRLGHGTPAAAMIYQHAAAGRDAKIAEALSKLAEAEAVLNAPMPSLG